ncbi:MAG: family 78 glycoside hydrolase catalytic domain [Clostridia bacterium]|nr:family 78 glycoside hydrolase catalytic domain [Clostridia bacterium]
MNQQQVFGNAVWLGAAGGKDGFYVLRGRFCASGVKRAVLRVLGLGFFHCYINGKRVGEDLFLPLNTDFEARENYPVDEIVAGHRIYVPVYDVTQMLREGENTIAIHFGGGWYTGSEKPFGTAKAIWRIFGEAESGAFDFVSSEEDRIGESFVSGYRLTTTEAHDYTLCSPEILDADYDDAGWLNASPARAPETEYGFSDCPPDRVQETLPVTLKNGVYDCGKNTTGCPVLRLKGKHGERVRVVFSEEIGADGALKPEFSHRQTMTLVSDGEMREVRPLFTWFGFRYFTVEGEADVLGVEVIHSDVKRAAAFESDNDLLNWIHDTYVNTQLTNMHAGIPSDCPHIERRGYTGDGQLACHAAMNILDAEAFYRKWMQDIADCQDVRTGHVQYTAPYVRSGGGPGGWGCAIVEVPWQFYMHYGDASVLEKYYPSMLRYFDYLEAHSYGKLVVSDKKGEWCLGDWCPPISVVLPAPFVNNYFYIKSLMRCIEIAKIIGKSDDIPAFEQRIAERKEAVMAAYFNIWDGNFLGGQQGANAFAVDIGLGDERTYPNLVEYYRKTGCFDTGIFGTDIVTRVLFERGDGQLAVDLLLSGAETSFDGMRRRGATTLWEYWPHSLRDRSHNHPMFGAVAAYLYDYLLGVRAKDGCAGYSEIVIEPALVNGVNRLSGGRDLPSGRVSVSYEKRDGGAAFVIGLPEGQKAAFVYQGKAHPLKPGENRFEF